MFEPDDLPESDEVLIEQLRRSAAGVSGLRLDTEIAVATARRDVLACYGHAEGAELMQRLVLALVEVREMRVQALADLAEIVCPVVVLDVETPGEAGE